MSGQAFFLTMSGISLSLAGFAGLLLTFRQPNQPWTRTDIWRLRRIVSRSFMCVFPVGAGIGRRIEASTSRGSSAVRMPGFVLLWPSSIFIRVLQDLSATD